MKKFLIILFVFLFISGCSFSVSNQTSKTEYKVQEEAILDQYKIICKDYQVLDSYLNQTGKFLKVNYIVTNLQEEKSTIHTLTDFKLIYDSKEYSNLIDEEIDLTNTEKEIELVYDITELHLSKPYKIIFYSNVVTNNVAFILE